MHKGRDRQLAFEREAMADGHAHRDTERIEAIARGDAKARTEHHIKRHVGGCPHQLVVERATDDQRAVVVRGTIAVGDAEVRRELRARIAQPFAPLEEQRRAAVPIDEAEVVLTLGDARGLEGRMEARLRRERQREDEQGDESQRELTHSVCRCMGELMRGTTARAVIT